jgi:phage shock protein PspC (stress-responsive transcriptional regulator)
MNNKKLYKDSKNGQISGVCVGLADYFNMDVSMVRIIMLLIVIFTGFGVVLYIVLAIALPEKETIYGPGEDPVYQEQDVKKKTSNNDDDLYEFNEDDYKY